MELIERTGFLDLLKSRFEAIDEGEGHCMFISGEAGIGKTSLLKTFYRQQKKNQTIYQGSCDALFTPRPLAPLYDILFQMKSELWKNNADIHERTGLFTRIFHELSQQREKMLIVFEDIHWADEATLDFIKFLARRITQLRCLFILTYRDDEINSLHPLRNVLGQLSPDSFSRIQLPPLSRKAVEKMALEKGYNGEDVYSISGGNPFYVHEILASYSLGIPDNIKDSILSIYKVLDEKTKQVWQILSVLPTSFEVNYLEKIEPAYATAIENCLAKKILILEKGQVFFKHELYRRTIETALSPLLRVILNKKILDMFLDSFLENHELERIIHHAKNANDYAVVVRYAPLAGKQAASLGAHIEASRLYLSAIEYYQGNDKDLLIELYESYAYECYLTNQIQQAIVYTGKSLNLWKEKNDMVKTGNSMRFLSRLWWFEGNRKNAESFGIQAIEVLKDQPSSKENAMAFSNMSQLKMLSDETKECLYWGEKAIAMARELKDEETLAHAYNSMGSAIMLVESSYQKGLDFLLQSLEIARRNSYHEHVARAYTAIGSNAVTMKDYKYARTILSEGIDYCEERDLDSLRLYMLGWKARLNLETGYWKEASAEADQLLRNENILPVIKIGVLLVAATLRFRRGDPDALPLLLEAKAKAFETKELQRIIPSLYALLEYEWLTGNDLIDPKEFDLAIGMLRSTEKILKKSRFLYWLWKAGKQVPLFNEISGVEASYISATLLNEAAVWEKMSCPYEQALALFEGDDNSKRRAIKIVHDLGAQAVYEKMKMEMRISGIRSIPRGIRKSTQSNPALLTGRELDVLKLLKDGMQNKEIAAKLFISAKTVDHHISSILFKLDVNSRTRAVREAQEQGFLK